VIGIFHATFSFDTFEELIELATSRVPSGVAFGSDHDVAASAVVAAVVDAVVVAAVVDDDVTAAVEVEDAELDVLDDLWLLPPQAAIAAAATIAANTVHARYCLNPLIVSLSTSMDASSSPGLDADGKPTPLRSQPLQPTRGEPVSTSATLSLGAGDHGPPPPTFLTLPLTGLPATDDTNNATD
jgi:hypothetical protein